MSFFEGDYTPRLEYLAELPKGKVLIHFDRTDAIQAREILGDRLCIKGNVPASLLITGAPSKVDQWCKNLIEAFDGHGLIMGGAVVGIPDEAKPENVKAMVDACHKYGPARR
jgi:uroporphyrinogen-III decarboxylase